MNREVYFNDPSYHRLTPEVRYALMHGQITPREAGESLETFLSPRQALLRAFQRQFGRPA